MSLWADSLPHCTGSFVPACHAETSQILASTKCRRPPRFHWFSTNFSSQYLCTQASYQKLVKAKSDHHHCHISVFLIMTCIQRPSRRSSTWVPNCPNGEGVRGGLPAVPLPPALISRWGKGKCSGACHLCASSASDIPPLLTFQLSFSLSPSSSFSQ